MFLHKKDRQVFLNRNQFIRKLVLGPPKIKKVFLKLQKIFSSVD